MRCIRRTILLLVGTARQRAAIGGAIFFREFRTLSCCIEKQRYYIIQKYYYYYTWAGRQVDKVYIVRVI